MRQSLATPSQQATRSIERSASLAPWRSATIGDGGGGAAPLGDRRVISSSRGGAGESRYEGATALERRFTSQLQSRLGIGDTALTAASSSGVAERTIGVRRGIGPVPLARQPGDVVQPVTSPYLGHSAITSARNREALTSQRIITSSSDGLSLRYREPTPLRTFDAPTDVAYSGYRSTIIRPNLTGGMPSLRTSGSIPAHAVSTYDTRHWNVRAAGHPRHHDHRRPYSYPWYWYGLGYPYISLGVSLGYPYTDWYFGLNIPPVWVTYGHVGYYRYPYPYYWYPYGFRRFYLGGYYYPYYHSTYVVYNYTDPEPAPVHVVDLDAEAPPARQVQVEAPSGAQAEVQQLRPLLPREAEELFFAGLTRSQLSFALGVIHFRDGHYPVAAEALYNASLDEGDSRMIKLFLGLALFSMGEYNYSAQYLKLALGDGGRYLLYRWDLGRLYGKAADLDKHVALIDEWLAVYPSDVNAHLARAYVLFAAGRHAEAAVSLDALQNQAIDQEARRIAEALAREIVSRRRPVPENLDDVLAASQDPEARFLQTLSLEDVKALPMK